ncbi:hypothetical protein TNCT_376061 [Trichonephila clavata]|uniref:Uncharacterized protein n=1 Tax=Trichonephila clavata TaxID=2740835 RepID=A0A8X6FDV2_TRICU|nr:hypothetical protein TNCT_376061 [Trichonephila clavata]
MFMWAVHLEEQLLKTERVEVVRIRRIKRYVKYFDISIKGVSRTIFIGRLKPCFFADPDHSKAALVNKSSTTNTSPSTVSATKHDSIQVTSEQFSKVRVRFSKPPVEYVTRSGRAFHPSKQFL